MDHDRALFLLLRVKESDNARQGTPEPRALSLVPQAAKDCVGHLLPALLNYGSRGMTPAHVPLLGNRR